MFIMALFGLQQQTRGQTLETAASCSDSRPLLLVATDLWIRIISARIISILHEVTISILSSSPLCRSLN